jgi:hypothetical protein
VEDLKDLAVVDAFPKLDGRNMVMVIAPTKKQAHHEERPAPAEEPQAATKG